MLLFVFVFVMVDQREKAESRLDSSSDLQGDEEEGNSRSGHGRSKREKESADLIVQFLTKLAICKREQRERTQRLDSAQREHRERSFVWVTN